MPGTEIPDYYEFLEISEEEWDRVMDINLKGTFLCGQAFARQMVKQGNGVIINIASVNATSRVASSTQFARVVRDTR